tara:strand:- start:451 stop:1080 length:630 start_codon:yes stop_codon:yes gene_type:complete
MLIPLNILNNKFNLNIKGVLHIGAHECEEQPQYLRQGVSNDNIYWVEAMPNKVKEMKNKNNKLNILQAVINDIDNMDVTFNITNNGQSSSFLEFGTHSIHHPHVLVTKKIKLKTTRLDTLINNNNIPIQQLNFMNLDIQGVELNALKSMGEYIKHIDYIYTEVNTEKVYKNCALISEIDDFLKTLGFERVSQKIYKQYGWGDAFYIRKY